MINVKLKNCCDYCNDAQIEVSAFNIRTGRDCILESTVSCKHASVCYKIREDVTPFQVHDYADYEQFEYAEIKHKQNNK